MATKTQYLDYVSLVHFAANKSKLSFNQSNSDLKYVKELKAFFQLDTTKTVLLSSIIYLTIRGSETSLNELSLHYGLEHFKFLPFMAAIKELSEIDLIEIEDNNPYQKLLNTEVKPMPNVMEALIRGDVSILRLKRIRSVGGFLHRYDLLRERRKLRSLSHEGFIIRVDDLLHQSSHLPFVKYIGMLNLSKIEKYILLSICCNTLKGKETSHVNEVLSELFTDLEDYYELSLSFKVGKANLIKLGLVESPFYQVEEVTVAAGILKRLDQNIADNEVVKTRICELERYEEMRFVKLAYTHQVGKSYQVISNALLHKNYLDLQKRLLECNLNKGIIILFHGPPGTGKTESVYQLAQVNKRHVLKVDVSTVVNLWMGETEKNIRRIFEEYRMVARSTDRKPILLFNEADAMLGSRREVRNSWDMMENRIQNILLQELEDFDGILIATTNMVENFDHAFDRRFLFKLKFELPDRDTRYKILKEKFGELNKAWLKEIAEKYEVTGGQIENVKRKVVMAGVIDKRNPISYHGLIGLFEAELLPSIPNGHKKRIGF